MVTVAVFIPQAVREQFEECDLIEIRQVRFAKDRHNATLEIKLNRQLAADAGWLVTLQSQKVQLHTIPNSDAAHSSITHSCHLTLC